MDSIFATESATGEFDICMNIVSSGGGAASFEKEVEVIFGINFGTAG